MPPDFPQNRIRDLLNGKAETTNLVEEVGSLLEDCIPNSSAWILRSPNTEEGAGLAFSSISCNHHSPASKPLVNVQSLISCAERLTLERRVSTIDNHPAYAALRAALPINEVSSVIAHRIRPSSGDTWGYILVLFSITNLSAQLRDEALAQGDLWVQFASTILERRILEDSLQTVETRLELATKAGGIGIFDLDIVTGNLYWTPQQYKVYGVTPQTFKPTYESWTDLIHPQDLEVIKETLQKTYAAADRYFRASHRFYLSCGEARWVESLGEVIYNDQGKPVRLIGTTQDCTDQVKAQAQIAEDRRRLELALEAGELGFWDWDMGTGRVQYGGQWGPMLGYSLEELEPNLTAWEKLVHPEDMPTVREEFDRHLQGFVPIYETEHRLRAKDGRWVWVLDRGRVVERDEHGRPRRAIGIHADITAQRSIRDRLRDADRRKDEFLATLAHELRNPLAPIRTGLAIMALDPVSPAATQARQIMERQLSHMVRLIDDLLDVSRITLGRLNLKKEEVSIRSIVELAVEAARPLLDAGHHMLTCTLPAEDLIINADSTRLSQTISNLLTNSAKYTPDYGAIDLSVTTNDHTIEIKVSDNGLGIPADMKERVFELFGQVNRTTDRAQGGLGIGLALVRNLVALHGGTVTVLSPGVGKGSTFTISLPLVLTKGRRSHGMPSDIQPTQTVQKRILIVDDNIDAATSLSMLTQLLGHATEVAYNGREALDKLSLFRPDVVFLDIGLPGMSGIEVAKLIRRSEVDPTPYVVALTGWGTEETKQKTKEAGFDEHLTKPVEISRVERILSDQSHAQQ